MRRVPAHVAEAFQRLELPPGADVRAVRARYAERLRARRPEDDPSAFERLREDYELCLAFARARGAAAAQDLGDSPPADAHEAADGPAARPPGIESPSVDMLDAAPAARPQPPVAAAHPPFVRDWDELAAQVLAQPDPIALGALLGGAPELESLSSRVPLEVAIVTRLAQGATPAHAVLERLAEWFGWNELGMLPPSAHVPPDWHLRFGAAMAQRQRLAFAHALAHGPYRAESSRHVALERAFLRRLAEPRPAWRVWIDVVWPAMDREMAMKILDHWTERWGQPMLDGCLDAGHVRTWLLASTPLGNRHATAVGLLRTVLLAFAAGALVLTIGMADHGPDAGALEHALLAFGITLGIGGAVVSLLNAIVAWLVFGRQRFEVLWVRFAHGPGPQRAATWSALFAAPWAYFGVALAFDLEGTGVLLAFALSMAYLGLGGLPATLIGMAVFAPLSESIRSADAGFHGVAGVCATMLVFAAAEFIVQRVIPRWRPAFERTRSHVALVAALIALPFLAWAIVRA